MTYDLVLSDNSTVPVAMSGVGQQGVLWLHVVGLSLVECVTVFSDPNKTARMTVDYDPTIRDEFTGYTVLTSVCVCDGFVKLSLERGV